MKKTIALILALFTLLGTLPLVSAAEDDFIDMTEMDIESYKVGWSDLKINEDLGGDRIDMTNADGGVTVYEKGFVAHADAELVFDIGDLGVTKFTALIGADHSGTNGDPSRTSVKFLVYVDGRKLYESGVFGYYTPAERVVVYLPEGASELKLVADKADGSNSCDHSCFAMPRLFVGEPENQILSSISVTLADTILEVGKTTTFTAKALDMFDEEMTPDGILYTSSNEKAAKIDGKGKVTAVGGGYATLTAAVSQGERTIKASKTVYVKGNASGKTTVVACSDFQNKGGDAQGAEFVSELMTTIVGSGYTPTDFLCCGDYTVTLGSSGASQSGLLTLKKTVLDNYPSITSSCFIKGNHDPAEIPGLAKSGNNDPASGAYGLFVINESDYMWYNSDEKPVLAIAEKLKTYLEEKEKEEYGKPIFVLSHLALHYSSRTASNGDGKYANYIFDLLNNAGAHGLNIIFLFGHDHSNGWDNYLGGSSVYLGRGDSICIAQASQTEFAKETLTFTYMNAGYTGYYSEANGADSTLTMSVFEISDNEVTVSRFDENGLHDLKSAGTYNSGYNDRSYYSSDTTVVKSPVTLTLTKGVSKEKTFNDAATGISATLCADSFTVKKETPAAVQEKFGTEEFSAYTSYVLSAGNYMTGGNILLTVPLGSLKEDKLEVYLYTGSTFKKLKHSVSGGKISVTANGMGTLVLASAARSVAKFLPYLYTYTTDGSVSYLENESLSEYLTCKGNADFGEKTELRFEGVTGGYHIALVNKTGSHAAGECLHFSTSTFGCSFGEATTAVFFENLGDGTFRRAESLENGKSYLVAFESGNNTYLMGNTVSNSRIRTTVMEIPINDAPDDPPDIPDSDYTKYLFRATVSGQNTYLEHISDGLYLTKDGNACFGTKTALVIAPSGGGCTLRLASDSGASTGYFHFGTANRCSFGAASIFSFYEYMEDDTFLEAGVPENGKLYLIVYDNGSTTYALTGSVVGSGISKRIETEALNIPEYTEPDPPTETPIEPTETPTEPTETPIEPTETPIEPTETPVEPTETPVEPTETPIEPTETPTEPTETPIEPTETPIEPTETPTEPTETPVEPTETPTEPTETPIEPTETPIEPTETPTESTETPVEPTEISTESKPTETTGSSGEDDGDDGGNTALIVIIVVVAAVVIAGVVVFLVIRKKKR